MTLDDLRKLTESGDAKAWLDYAIALGNINQHQQALEASEHVNTADGHFIKGVALSKLGRAAEALEAWKQSLKLDPAHADSMARVGIALSDENHAEAEKLLNKSCSIKPKNWRAFDRLGHVRKKLGKNEEAVSAFRKAIELNPHNPEIRANLGVVLFEIGDISGAEDVLRQTIKMKPDSISAHWNLSLCLLHRGDFRNGWIEYEWRRGLKADPFKQRALPQPEWNGCPLDGQTILLRSEQGLGDTIQFARYAARMKKLGVKVILECQTKLGPLMRGTDGVDEVIESGPSAPPTVNADLQVRLMSLPGILGTTFEAIPADVPYIKPPSDRMDFWRRNMEGVAGFKVGIAWQGNPSYGCDSARSIPLKFFEPLGRIPNVNLFSLQKGFGEEQLRDINFHVHVFDPELDLSTGGAFVDTAAVLKNLDLLITSDTSIAHLAGAMAVPTWVALCKSPDWRWRMSGEKTPWYPTMRLFRQKRAGVWTDVFSKIAKELSKMAGNIDPVVESVTVETSPGELLDRLTILNIKSKRITDKAKLLSVTNELRSLQASAASSLPPSKKLDELTARLLEINETLWEIEDEIRNCDREEDFGEKFVALAQSVYQTNDLRSSIKREINRLLGSNIADQKSYSKHAQQA